MDESRVEGRKEQERERDLRVKVGVGQTALRWA
jgi:hypothetical protein